jgi:predicted alpha/beta superfamily hydrolase
MIINHNIYLPTLKVQRTIRVYLPPSYEKGQRYYSVVYMHDGQNLFEEQYAFGRPWYIGRIIDKMPIYKQAIVVGIDNGSLSRIDEYAPFKNKGQGGKGAAYMQDIVKTIKPYIESQYRTLNTPEHTWLVGSSMGGLITLYGALMYPNVFGKLGVFSPAIWFNPEILTQNPSISLENNRFYVVGSKTESQSMEKSLQNTYWRLKALGVSDDRLTAIIRERGGHNEAFWGREFKKMYEVFMQK